jgi:hypothetical protein
MPYMFLNEGGSKKDRRRELGRERLGERGEGRG